MEFSLSEGYGFKTQ